MQANETINWIDVNDRLPDDEVTVLVACQARGAFGYEVYEAWKDTIPDSWRANGGEFGSCVVQNVKYWAEMPAGPKVEVTDAS